MTDARAAEHELKCWPQYFQPILDGRKTFEIRLNDRAFKVGDTLLLREWDPDTREYSGRTVTRRVTYLTAWEQKPGYVVMALDHQHALREAERRGLQRAAEYVRDCAAVLSSKDVLDIADALEQQAIGGRAMKRYGHRWEKTATSGPFKVPVGMDEQPDGEFVKYADVRAVLQHAMYRNHRYNPGACDGCKRVEQALSQEAAPVPRRGKPMPYVPDDEEAAP